MREVADVHRDALPRARASSTARTSRAKIERCLEVTRRRGRRRGRGPRGLPRATLAAVDGLDLLLTPTLAFVAPPAGIDEIALRERLIRFTFPFNVARLAGARAALRAAEDGLPASVAARRPPGDDALVLGAGRRARTSCPSIEGR